MQGKFICHKDFSFLKPIDVFHKEHENKSLPKTEEKYKNRHILFRKKFTLADYQTAMIGITADDYFKLYINGKFVMQGPPPSYPNAYLYMQKDVSEYLRRGENVIAVHTYYQGLINRVWVSGDLRESFWCELTADGKIVAASDESWKCANHTAYSACGVFGYDTAYAERYDSRAKEVGFEKAEYNDESWENASVYENADYRLVKSSIEPLEVYYVSPQKIERKENVYFIDFGREYVGQLYAKAKGNRGDEIVLRYGEELSGENEVRYNLRCNCKYEEKWILSGGDDETDQFDYKAFRYAGIIAPGGVEIGDIKMLVRHYPFEKKAVYETPNADLRRVLKLCEDTIRYGTQEVFVDCPTREKGQYLGDAFISGRAQAILTGDATLLKKTIVDFCNSAFISAGIMAVSTSSFMQEIADYSLLFAPLVLWTYRFDRDEAFLKRAYPYVKGAFEYFCGYKNERGLLENVTEKWNLVDWPENLRDGYDFPLMNPIGNGVHNVINAFWIGFLKAFDKLSEIMGLPVTGKAERTEKSYIEAFFNEETGLFCDSTAKNHSAIHSNVLPLYFGVKKNDRAFVKNAVKFIEEKRLTSMGVYMSYFALAALKKNGDEEKAVALATDKNAWLNMITEGGTATFEAWGKEQKWNTSLFHPWAVAPLIVFSKIDLQKTEKENII